MKLKLKDPDYLFNADTAYTFSLNDPVKTVEQYLDKIEISEIEKYLRKKKIKNINKDL